jgi:hypothetical protein
MVKKILVFPGIFREILPYYISANSVGQLIEYMELSIKVNMITNQNWPAPFN